MRTCQVELPQARGTEHASRRAGSGNRSATSGAKFKSLRAAGENGLSRKGRICRIDRMDHTIISKSLLLSHRQCAKRAWLEAHGEQEGRRSLGQEAVIEQGQEVHAAGRARFPSAPMVNQKFSLDVAAHETRRLMEEGADALLEAAAVGNGLGVRFDVLKRGQKAWRITEIKSGASVKDEYLDDCAIQYAAASAAGLPIEGVEVMHPDTAIARPKDGTGAEVLVSEVVTDTVHWRSLLVPAWVEACRDTLDGPMPAIKPGEQCSEPNQCPFAHICGKPEENKDTDLIRFLPNKVGAIKDCIEQGITRISQVPAHALETDRNRLVWDAIKQGRTIIRKDIARKIAALPYPRSYIDFEGAGFAIPRFAGMRPFEPMMYQFSCHQQAAAGAEVVHHEFIDVSGADPRRAFCEWLLEAVGEEGPVMVFSAYERTQLKALAKVFPDLEAALMRLVSRLVDLYPMAREGYYDPRMLGSWSIKKIEPTLPPDEKALSYAEMGEVADGMAAQGAYALMTNQAVIGTRKDELRDQSLRYCGGDTWNLLRFVRVMEAAAL